MSNLDLTEELLVKNNPIEAVVHLLEEFCKVSQVQQNNEYAILKEKTVLYLFEQYVMGLTPEAQIAAIEIVQEKGDQIMELILLETIHLPRLLKNFATQTNKVLVGDNIEHFIAYDLISDYANDYETLYNKLLKTLK
jgi:hypothetical protein